MRFLTKMRKQWAVYWPPASTDQFSKVKYGTPVELRVRWKDSTELFMDKAGKEQVAHSKVYVGLKTAAGVAVEVKELGVLWLGPNYGKTAHPLTGLDTAHRNDPFKNLKAWTIQRLDISPDAKAKDFLVVAFL